MKSTNNFNKDLAFGNESEAYLVSTYPDKFELLDGRNADLKLKESGKLFELKTERRSDLQTANIFVERISNKNKMTVGGPWKAKEDGCEYIAYLFWPTKNIFVYPVKKLIRFLETDYRYVPYEVNVANSKAVGFIVPRAHIEHLLIPLESLK